VSSDPRSITNNGRTKESGSDAIATSRSGASNAGEGTCAAKQMHYRDAHPTGT
jgi:hypothetical protein